MKQIQIFAAALVGLLLLSFVGVAAYRLANPVETLVASAAPTVEPTPTAIPCPDNEIAAYLGELDALLARWEDAVTLADSTSRIALSAPVANLQAIRQEAAALSAPPCAQHLQELQLIYMDFAIKGFLAFMQESSDFVLDQLFMSYARAHTLHSTYLQEFRADPLSAYASVETPESLVDTFVADDTWQTIRTGADEPWKFSMPPEWANPPADDYDKILIKDKSGHITLNLYTKSNVPVANSKFPPTVAFLVRNELAFDGAQAVRFVRFGDNVGPLLVASVASGETVRMAGAIEAPDGTAFMFDAQKDFAPFTEEEKHLIYNILASVRRFE